MKSYADLTEERDKLQSEVDVLRKYVTLVAEADEEIENNMEYSFIWRRGAIIMAKEALREITDYSATPRLNKLLTP
jgi:hypothetical protein